MLIQAIAVDMRGLAALRRRKLFVGWSLTSAKIDGTGGYNGIHYLFFNRGSAPFRTRTQIGALAEAHALFTNNEIIQSLESIFFRESNDTLDWIVNTLSVASGQFGSLDFKDQIRVNASTIFQAYIMGYYYGILFRFVDTSDLQLKVGEGSWGYRDHSFLENMRSQFLNLSPAQERDILIWPGEAMVRVLSTLFCSSPDINPSKPQSLESVTNCIGKIGRRSLLVWTLLKPCQAFYNTGKFILLDIDVSGIPRGSNGIVRPGIADIDKYQLDHLYLERARSVISPVSEVPIEDVTFHVEADWEGNSGELLLRIRYRGRRLGTLDPSIADMTFFQPRVLGSLHWIPCPRLLLTQSL